MILDYKGIQIFYNVQGSGDAVVLLHGFLENSSMWNTLIPEITKHNKAITIDLLGHGKTGCLGYVHSMELMAEAVEAVLNYLKIEKSIIIGHSMGGYVALAFAEKNPKALNGICLMNSTFEADDNERKLLRTRANKMVKSNFENMVRMSFTNLFSNESKVTYRKELDNALKQALNTSLQGYVACNEGMKIRKNRANLFINLPIKKSIIIGIKDPVIEPESIKKQLLNSDVEIIVFSDGHMSHIENTQELTYNIMRFIEN
ncbi:alpha/beta hydrolase [Xanthomarina spongicola]|uniref:Pimeloyl-ACP methyl ester carboxylesterase n=1 Tax=Xanthomarina spongicola TaxID=570520 RepID=A0A316DSA3_9FLAO|nr:alpha/beta hydrolase [Xanthomarina spongicola]PWK20332.1 pimeloyl-ACP methyl ester carboxylesterase [Xanthomarina spongicola]